MARAASVAAGEEEVEADEEEVAGEREKFFLFSLSFVEFATIVIIFISLGAAGAPRKPLRRRWHLIWICDEHRDDSASTAGWRAQRIA